LFEVVPPAASDAKWNNALMAGANGLATYKACEVLALLLFPEFLSLPSGRGLFSQMASPYSIDQ